MSRNLIVHDLSVPQFRPPARLKAHGVLSFCIDSTFALNPSLPVPDVVHHAVQVPLRVDLDASPLVQTSQVLVVPDVSKYWLDRANALAVELPAPG